MSYPIPQATARAEIDVKKSRFIALARHISDKESAMQWLAEVKANYPDARHHCWAYQFGNPNCATHAGMGDDGEPSGTAGKPILNVLQHKGIGDIMLIVVRYFGGIKLGAGGLTRAYGQAAQAVMEVLPIQTFIPMQSLSIQGDFADEQRIRHWVDVAQGNILQVDYQQQLHMLVAVPLDAVTDLTTQLDHLSHLRWESQASVAITD